MKPEVIESVAAMQRFADEVRSKGKRVGVVPTMGALHEGHMSLVRIAARLTDIVVCTIFVNPAQFGPDEDLDSYPRSREKDVQNASKAGASVVFAPSASEMYHEGHQTYVVNEKISDILEGRERPGHFKGVATIVLKLFAAVKPHVAVFGQKDAQQLALIRTMVRDLGLDVEIVGGPIVREPDGLALSSRNVYLSPDERKRAAILHTALERAETLVTDGVRSLDRLKREVRATIESVHPTRIDYVEAVHPDTFSPLGEFRDEGTLLVLTVRFGSTRLLDNRTLLGPEERHGT